MENLPKDLRRKIALELSPSDLIRFCVSEKKMYEEICNSKEFWREKIARDFPEVFSYFQRHKMILHNPKNTYIRKFTEIFKMIDEFVNQFPKNIQTQLYNDIYNLYEEKKDQRIRIGNYKALRDKALRDKYQKYTPKSIAFDEDVGKIILRLVTIYDYYKKY